MIALIQRVKHASVTIGHKVHSKIDTGLLILLGVVEGDTETDLEWTVKKCAKMRIFPDDNNVMNRDITEFEGDILAVSQFTLAADIRKGNRPSYIKAMRPEKAEEFYDRFCTRLSEESGTDVKTGVFGADMDVDLLNWGPVTILVDSAVAKSVRH